MMRGELNLEGTDSEYVKKALDLCLSCKACKNECPVNVDIATYKAEFFAHYYEKRWRPLSAYAFATMDRWAALASMLPCVANLSATVPVTRKMLKRVLNISPERQIPKLANRSFRRSLPTNRQYNPVASGSRSRSPRRVLLWADTWNNYFRPRTALSALRVLEDAGYQVLVSQRRLCCGRPLYDFGMLDHAKRYLHRIYDELAPLIDQQVPVVVLEPSCASVFRDEAVNLLANDAKYAALSEQFAGQIFLLSQFLTRRADHYVPINLTGTNVILQSHCHQTPLIDTQVKLLQLTGASVQLLDSGCCGMAGPFGFEKNNYAVSKETCVVADGFSCREQIEQLSGRPSLHIAELIVPKPL
jgi:Fe-S oxidoreductase